MPTEGESRNVQSGITIEETNICRIFKVPNDYINEDNFKPKILSICPYHCGSSHLKDMESVKLICRHSILGRISESYYDRDEIKGIEKKARSFYGENITMEPNKFAEMLLLDGCFIGVSLGGMEGKAAENVSDQTATTLENKAMSIGGETAAGSDAMKGESSQRTTSSDTLGPEEGGERLGDFKLHEVLHRDAIVRDLLLLENQIPFFVLEEIHKLAAREGETTESLKEKIATYVESALGHYPKAIKIPEICSNDFHHLLHLCHMFLFQPSPVVHHRDQAVMNQPMWHRATQYDEAGVKFRVKPSSTCHSLLDVTFSNGTMEIPCLSIDAKTETIFSNLILFEKGCSDAGKYMNAYVTFMSQLLSDADDVELLLRNRIIEILGREEEILNVFSRLNGLAVFNRGEENYYLTSTLQSEEAHYGSSLNQGMTWLKRNHLRNPCLAFAAFAAFIGLLCTVIQGFFAVFQYIKPRN